MARPTSQRVNLASIAEQLGVSISTVSRALRGQDGIHQETRAKIVGLAHQMGYSLRPATAAESSSSQPALRHVLALSQTSSPQVDQRYMAGMSGAAVAANVAVLAHLVAEAQCASVLDPRLGPASLRAGLVRGVVFLHRWPKEVVAQISQKIPAVSVVHDYPGTEADLIGIDDRTGVSELVAHFHAGGHRRIGFFGLCPEVSWSGARFAAYVEALLSHGLEFDARDVIRVDSATAMRVDEFGPGPWSRELSNRIKAGVDAWLCPSAITGRSLLRHLRNQGTRVPDAVAVANYHGSSPVDAAGGLPQITTTDIVDEELGAAAVRRLMTRLDNPHESRRAILIPARLRIRQTTRQAPAAGRASGKQN